MSLMPSPAAARPRRRALLTGALGTTGAAFGLPLLAACTSGEAAGDADGAGADAARRLRSSAARDSEHLLARYDGTTKVHPALAAPLRPLREEVLRHVRVLRDGEPGTRSPSPGARGSRSPSGAPGTDRSVQPGGRTGASEGPPGPDTASVPKSPEAALAALARAERQLADTRTKALDGAPPELARLLASVAACGSAHGYLLDQRGKDTGSGDDGGSADDGMADEAGPRRERAAEG
ncbi:hypothetical protein [Streptomyces qinglanensis]|uniref:Lipoprotein n=1 Tax=Streptomyces qinglanensis TaxID=943816 RepID=A0A1H9VVR6_9ACTN|nr:hypothetical protein [Streptomyces qinglanensis]SES25383.1 hypothetical protein SAMN05421870_113161 [Streptomyces qinglanensis]